ncbi:MAG: thio(seleno)oxazole modification radical SAM maturase SbtM [Thermodesulfobacteriota bacterium]
MSKSRNRVERIPSHFPRCRQLIGRETFAEVLAEAPAGFVAEHLPELLAGCRERFGFPPWLADLARIEAAAGFVGQSTAQLDTVVAHLVVNPTLHLVEVGWRRLADIFLDRGGAGRQPPIGDEIVLVWLHPRRRSLEARAASGQDLLALKVVVEELDRRQAAAAAGISLAELDRAIAAARAAGLLLAPPSKLARDPALFAADEEIPEQFLSSPVFTLQWHLTQACDLHCRHCYDRSNRSAPTLAEAVSVLDQLYDFCRDRHVYGQVSFTGGNPLLHPHFLEIYREAADRGLMTAILGNPTDADVLEKIKALQRPEFYQVSLEGLREHNDHIRGAGHFDRVFAFLDRLKAAGIYSMVMLTLTRDNLDQVLPLAELLRDRVDLFTFNRLSMVGEGARLRTPGRDEYQLFLRKYLEAVAANPAMALKDNLINILRHQEGAELFGGCAGYGCGAAFNFVALLPDGEVHACRKFPSPIGDLRRQSLTAVYDSQKAAGYRRGPAACSGCRIRHVCGGCLAVIASAGLDVGRDRDPCCFFPV